MTLDELQDALTETSCSGDTPIRATLGDAPLEVVGLELDDDVTPPRAVTLQLRPLLP